MSVSVVPQLRQNNVDFTDENLTGLSARLAYTSFENNMKNRQSKAAAPAESVQDQILTTASPGTRSIDMSLAKSTKPKGIGAKLAKLKESEPVDYALQQQAIPSNIPVYSLNLDPAKLICFYGRDNFLSNYFTAPMTVNGVAYRTVEHYYEACKLFSFGGAQWSSQLNIVKDPGAAKATSKRMMGFIDRRKVDAWKRTEGLAVIEHALMVKFTSSPELTDKLLATGDAYLAHCNPHDILWGTGLNVDKVKQWATTNQNLALKVPRKVNPATLVYFPTTLQGQNVLGYLLMQLRRQLNEAKNIENGQQQQQQQKLQQPVENPTSSAAATAKQDDTTKTASQSFTAATKPIQAPIGTALVKQSSTLAANDSNSLTALGESETVQKLCAQLAKINTQNIGGI